MVTSTASALLLATALAPVAEASAQGCTPIGNYRYKGVSPNLTCIDVKGDGHHVTSVKVNVEAPAGGVNNIVIRIDFYDVHNQLVEENVSSPRNGTRTFEVYSIVPDKDYPSGRVCGSFTENGVERPGACEGIHG